MISRQTRLTMVVAFCSATVGLAMLYVGFFLGTEIATVRLSVTTEAVAPAATVVGGGANDGTAPVNEKDASCEAQRADISAQATATFATVNAGHPDRWVEIGEIFWSPYVQKCVYLVTNHIVTSRGPGESLILSAWHEDERTKDDRLVIMDAFQNADDYDARYREFRQRVDQYRRLPPPGSANPFR